ncbi:hypothetical protein COCNU_09G006140 [Cocos nucifera]|uniref:DEP domain-containing protein n=1 Tax=Cocos nucifera TaxID=13894 RepID=A0A8K0IKM7_COCNU|nr:hypothetical protein COCNU_09G006140 [Cocos nucifera]
MGDAAASIPLENKDSAGNEGNQYKPDSPTQDSGEKSTDQAENGEDSEGKLAGDDHIDSDEQWSQKILCPPSPLPQPAPPPGLATPRPAAPEEFHLSDLKVIVQPKKELDDKDVPIDGQGRREIKGRVAFFSRSSCRDCGAVRSFLREKSLPYIEINIDVFPSREKELIQRTGSAAVPKIFVNEKLLGGLEALNALRNSGEFDRTVREMARERCPETSPKAPIYGLDDKDVVAGPERTDEMAEIVRVLRQTVAISDRLVKMTFVKKCFAGSELVEAIIHHLDCGRKKGVEVAKELARKHFIHHVFRENEFEDANHQFYRFLEHDPIIPKCFNFRGSTNDNEPKPVTEVACRLTKLMTAMLEAYASDDRHHLDYACISVSEEFRRYVNMVQDLQRVDVFTLSGHEKLTFFMNLYNAMIIHGIVRVNRQGIIDRRSAFFSDFHYMIGGHPYSFSSIKDGILRSNRRQPYSISKPFSTGDRRLELVPPKPNLLIHFGLCDGTRSSPIVRFFSTQGIEAELRHAAREFFHGGEAEVDLENRMVRLTGIIKWYSVDFGQEKEILKWILDYLDASKAGLLMHLLNDGGPIKIVYKKYDWSLNY